MINGIPAQNIVNQEENRAYNVSGAIGTLNSTIGRVLSIDTTANSTVKLAADGEDIMGISFTPVENNNVSAGNRITVARRGIFLVARSPELAGGDIPAVGDFVVGAVSATLGAGFIRKSTSNARSSFRVQAVNGVLGFVITNV